MKEGQAFAVPLIPIFRIVTLCLSFVLAVTVMDLSSHLTSFTVSFEGKATVFALLAVASAGLTILTLPIMLIIDYLCNGAFASSVLVELIWLGILSAIWLTTGVDGADSINTSFLGGCVSNADVALSIACHDSVGVIALSFINFLLLLAYSMTLFVFATISSNRGHSVWASSIKQANLSALSNDKSSNPSAYGGRDLHSRIPSCS